MRVAHPSRLTRRPSTILASDAARRLALQVRKNYWGRVRFVSKLSVWLGLSAVATASLSVANRALAQTAAPAEDNDALTRTAARDLAQQGAEAFERQQYDVALDLFTRAASLVQAPTIALMRARSFRQLGRWVEAMDAYEIAQRMPTRDTNPAFAEAATTAAQEAAALRPKLPRLNLRVEGSAKPGEAEVLLDSRKFPLALLGVDTPLDPGEHQLEVRAKGQAPIVRQVALEEGEREEVLITLQPPPRPAPLAPPPATPVRSQPPRPEETRAQPLAETLSWAAIGIGAVSLGTGIVTGIVALDKKSELDEVCRPGCPRDKRDDIHYFRSYRTVSFVTIGVGAAAVLGGASVLVYSRVRGSSNITLRVGPDRAVFALRF